MSFEENPTGLRVDHSYENEFGLVTSSAVLAVISFGLLITCVMPNITWAYVATTTGPAIAIDPTTNATAEFFPITIEKFSLWDFSCSTPGMQYTYGLDMCNTRYQSVEAFSTLACVFSIIGLVFGIMPFSPVSPREPKQALTHSMVSHMLSGMFALVSWAVFYGGLVFGVWQSPSQNILNSGLNWEPNVIVTNGGILAVSGWVGAFLAWIFSLSAMIKYDASAAEQAILAHKQRKEQRKRKKQEIIQRLGEGAFRAAHDKESIPLDLGDKLYLGGTISAGGTACVAWANMSIVPYLFQSPYSLAVVAGALLIANTVASTTGALVLLVGLTDMIPRPKASVGGFAVFSTVTVCWCCTFGMIINYITVYQVSNQGLLTLEAAVGTLGIACSMCCTIVLYHPFKIWEKDFLELPRPAKIHKGENGLGLVLTSAATCLLALCLSMAAITVFTIEGSDFAAVPTQMPTLSPTVAAAPTTFVCPNGRGAQCNVGNDEERCCIAPYECIETAFTKYTCEFIEPEQKLVGIRDAYAVAQAFLGLTIGFSAVAYVFAGLALCPNGVMDIKAALNVLWGTALGAFLCAVVTFSVLQGYVLSSGGAGMPIECGYLLGAFFAQAIGAVCAFTAWRAYRDPGSTASYTTLQDDLFLAQRELEIEKTRLDIVNTRRQRLEMERALAAHEGDDEERQDDKEEYEEDPVTASELQVI